MWFENAAAFISLSVIEVIRWLLESINSGDGYFFV
jgi:hypothetical protein